MGPNPSPSLCCRTKGCVSFDLTTICERVLAPEKVGRLQVHAVICNILRQRGAPEQIFESQMILANVFLLKICHLGPTTELKSSPSTPEKKEANVHRRRVVSSEDFLAFVISSMVSEIDCRCLGHSFGWVNPGPYRGVEDPRPKDCATSEHMPSALWRSCQAEERSSGWAIRQSIQSFCLFQPCSV